ncbi:hypothetical protein AB0O01_34790 [Streptomyces sp. NPDC093252]|uniref:hypothetical protein n=1 Tax=Streptomyces sp. NPDC093252 TaxID=3154980 RepID=UPI00344995D5
MANGTLPIKERPPGVKLVIEVFTVNRDGIVTPPRATVLVPEDFVPSPYDRGPWLEPCACPAHRAAPVR